MNYKIKTKKLPPQKALSMDGEYTLSTLKRYQEQIQSMAESNAQQVVITLKEGESVTETSRFQVYFPVNETDFSQQEGIILQDFPGVTAITAQHKGGDFDDLPTVVEAVFLQVKEKGHSPQAPCRLFFHKPPAKLFRPNDGTYTLEAQVPVTLG